MAKFDLAVLGGGPGGYVAAIRGAQLGLKTCVIDKDKLGGICLNWGCIPTKALLKNAEVYHTVKNAGTYGINVGKVSVDFKKNIKRSRDVSNRLSKGIEFLMKKNKIIIGMVHFPPLPGTPNFDDDKNLSKIVNSISSDLDSLQNNGIDAVMFGNEGDRPYLLKASNDQLIVLWLEDLSDAPQPP